MAAAATVPGKVGVFSDLDGTLSHIVANPDTVTPVDGAVDHMTRLADACGRVAVVSGRPISFLERFFEPPVELSGLYGIEHRTGDLRTVDPVAVEWMPVIAAIAADGAERFGASAVEDKTYSLTVHYRGATPERAAEVEAWSDQVAIAQGLHARSAKMSVEIHPPIERNKGDAIADMLDGLSAAVYFGDDVGDRSAFERLTTAREGGSLQASASVLVNGVETPDELIDAVTDVVTTPEEAVAMLDQVLRATAR